MSSLHLVSRILERTHRAFPVHTSPAQCWFSVNTQSILIIWQERKTLAVLIDQHKFSGTLKHKLPLPVVSYRHRIVSNVLCFEITSVCAQNKKYIFWRAESTSYLENPSSCSLSSISNTHDAAGTARALQTGAATMCAAELSAANPQS